MTSTMSTMIVWRLSLRGNRPLKTTETEQEVRLEHFFRQSESFHNHNSNETSNMPHWRTEKSYYTVLIYTVKYASE